MVNFIKRPWDNYPKHHHPKQRIFLSIDAIDSTKIKSTLIEKVKKTSGIWAENISYFLHNVLFVYREKLRTLNFEELHSTINLWKYIGDEVVLIAELGEEHHASVYVSALAETIKEFNTFFDKKEPFNDSSLKLKLHFKGTAWIAGFPATNIELDLPDTNGLMVKDFVGPSMDLGFRLSKFATHDRLIISASLAFFIAGVSNKEAPNFHISLCFGGMVDVKGVKNGEHPLIWFSVMNSEESKLCIVDDKILRNYLKKDFFDLDIFPFLPDTGNIDTRYDEYYNEAVREQVAILGSPFFGS